MKLIRAVINSFFRWLRGNHRIIWMYDVTGSLPFDITMQSEEILIEGTDFYLIGNEIYLIKLKVWTSFAKYMAKIDGKIEEIQIKNGKIFAK